MIHSDGVHVVSDTSLEELHEWAKRYGLKRHWFHRGRWPHYDLPKRHFHYTAEIGTTRQLIEAMRNGPILDELIAEDRSRIGLTDAGLPYRGPVTR